MAIELADFVSGVISVTNTDGFPFETNPPRGMVTIGFRTGKTMEIEGDIESFQTLEKFVKQCDEIFGPVKPKSQPNDEGNG